LLLTEQQRLAVLDPELVLGLNFLIGQMLVDAVVVDDAVLQNLDKTGAAERVCAFQ
jgi:hypothetical protein